MTSSNDMNSKDSKNFSTGIFYRKAKKQSRKSNISPCSAPPKSWKSEHYNTIWGRKKSFPLWNVNGTETSALIQPAGRQNQILFQTRGEKGREGEVGNQEKWIHLLQKIKGHHTQRAKRAAWFSAHSGHLFSSPSSEKLPLKPSAWHFSSESKVKCNVYTEARWTVHDCFCRKVGMKWSIIKGWKRKEFLESHLECLCLKE